MFEPEISIAGRKIGPLHPPYIICELSANHNGSLERAIKMIEVAAETDADAIKIQTYTADTLTIDCNRPEFQIKGGLWDGYTLYKLYREASTPYEWHPALFQRARELGVTIFSTPFDDSAVELLAALNAPAYKIASFEAIDLPLITRVARECKPMIISTGMAGLGEIASAVTSARDGGADGVALLHCISAYPAPIEAANVRTVPHLAAAFGVVSGPAPRRQWRPSRSGRRSSKNTSLCRAPMADRMRPSRSSRMNSSNWCRIANRRGPRWERWTTPEPGRKKTAPYFAVRSMLSRIFEQARFSRLRIFARSVPVSDLHRNICPRCWADVRRETCLGGML